MLQPARALLVVTAVLWLAACSGSDSSSPPPSTTNQTPSTAQQPTTPPPTTPTTAPTAPAPAPGSGSGGTGSGFIQGYGFNGLVRTIVMTQDGTRDLYVGGDFTNYNGTTANRLIRLHQDGTVAQTFGQGFDQPVTALAAATDGSNALYVGGWFTRFNGQTAPPVIRITATGVRDSTFQVSGLFGDQAVQATTLVGLAVTEDGSRDVYVAGNIVVGVPNTPVDQVIGRVVRLNPDGSHDPAFGDVRYVGPADDNEDRVWAIAVAPGSSKVYVGGLLGAPNGLIRLNPDGTLDSTFAGVPGSAGTIELAADASRDIYAGGLRAFGPVRVHETGAVDTTFSPTQPLITLPTYAIVAAEDGTGDVVVFGSLGLLRLNRTGGRVPTFLEPTLSPSPPGPGNGSVLTMVPIPDGTGDLYIGGSFSVYNGAPANNFARIHADGSLASTGVALP